MLLLLSPSHVNIVQLRSSSTGIVSIFLFEKGEKKKKELEVLPSNRVGVRLGYFPN
jgi:hypothetical protein